MWPNGGVGDGRSRQAVVYLRDGRGYEGSVELSYGWVIFDGVRRTNTGDQVIYHQAGERTWPRRQVRSIRWLPGPGNTMDPEEWPR